MFPLILNHSFQTQALWKWLLYLIPTKITYDNQQVVVVDNIMMIDTRNSGTFLEGQRQNKKNSGLKHPRRSILRPKGSGDMKEACAFHFQKYSLVKSPILDQKGWFITWFMLLLKYGLCDIIFKLIFFQFLFSTFTWTIVNVKGFPSDSDSKESASNAGDPGSIPGLARSPGEGNGNPLQYSGLENPMDRGAWWATVNGVSKESDTTEWLSHQMKKALFFSLPMSGWENHLPSFEPWFPHLKTARLSWRSSPPPRCLRKSQMELVPTRSSTSQTWKGNQIAKMRNFLSTNIL